MNIFKHRPTFCFALLFLFFFGLVFALPRTGKTVLLFVSLGIGAACAVLCLICRLRGKRLSLRRFLRLLLVLFLLLASVVPNLLYDKSAETAERYLGKTCYVKISVHEITYKSEGFCYATGTLTEIGNKPTDTRISFSVSGTDVRIGELLGAHATVRAVDPNDEDAHYLLARGCRFTTELYKPRVLEYRNSLTTLSASLRASVTELISHRVGEEPGALLNALFLGERANLSDTLNRDMGRIGISHMLALSGLNLSILMLGTERLLGLLGIGKRFRFGFLACLIVAYLFLTGFSVSAVRAGCMLLFMVLSFFLGQEHDGITALSVSVCFICLFQPYAITDVSLLLSALATFGILLTVQPNENTSENAAPSLLRRIGNACLLILKTTVAATVATLPITIFAFGYLPLLSLIGNLFFNFLLELLLFSAILILLFGWIPLLCTAVVWLYDAVAALASFFAHIPHTLLALREPFVLTVLLIATLLLFLLCAFAVKRRARTRITVCVLLSAVFLIGSFHGVRAVSRMDTLTLKYTAADSVRGDVMLLRENGCVSVIDATAGSNGDNKAIFALLEENNCFEVDHFVLVNYHKANAESAVRMLEKRMLHHLHLPPPRTQEEAEIAEKIYRAARENETNVSYYAFGEGVTLGGAAFSLHEKSDLGAPHAYARFSLSYGTYRAEYLSFYALLRHDPQEITAMARAADCLLFGTYGYSASDHNFFLEEFERTAQDAAPIPCYSSYVASAKKLRAAEHGWEISCHD